MFVEKACRLWKKSPRATQTPRPKSFSTVPDIFHMAEASILIDSFSKTSNISFFRAQKPRPLIDELDVPRTLAKKAPWGDNEIEQGF
jgi:hypothetical protein